MIDVVLRVQRRRRRRVERGGEVTCGHPLPEHAAPAEVVVGVVVAAAERARRELQVPEDRADQDGADDEQRRATVQQTDQTRAPRRRAVDFADLPALGLFAGPRGLRGYSPALYVLHNSLVNLLRQALEDLTGRIEST